jgi:hypothetical protein
MIRDTVKELLEMGPPPSEAESIRNPTPFLEKYQQLLLSIEEPVTDEEATVLSGLFGADGCFGLGWTLMGLIETAPNWPIDECLGDSGNEWIELLKNRAARWRDEGYPARPVYTRAGLPDPKQNQGQNVD